MPYETARGSVQQRFCVGCAPQKLSFVRWLSFTVPLVVLLRADEMSA